MVVVERLYAWRKKVEERWSSNFGLTTKLQCAGAKAAGSAGSDVEDSAGI